MSRIDHFVSRPYSERRLVTLIDREYEIEDVPEDKSFWEVAYETLKLIAPGGGGITLIFEALKELRKKDVEVVPVPASWASELILPPGHPRNEVLYVAHPAHPRMYVPAADFHRFTFEHKFAEAVRVLTYLGATEIKVSRDHGWGRDFSSKVSANIPEADVGSAEGAASVEQRSDEGLLYEAELRGGEPADLPDDMVWYPHEPTWQYVVEGRQKFGLKNFAMKVHYKDDFGVNADLSVDAKTAGL